MPNSAENGTNQQIPARIITRDWLKKNVKVGWIAETLHLPMIAAVTPILERFLVDVEADLREEITKLRGDLAAAQAAALAAVEINENGVVHSLSEAPLAALERLWGSLISGGRGNFDGLKRDFVLVRNFLRATHRPACKSLKKL